MDAVFSALRTVLTSKVMLLTVGVGELMPATGWPSGSTRPRGGLMDPG